MSDFYSTILGFRVFAGTEELALNRITEQAEQHVFQNVTFVNSRRLLLGKYSTKISNLLHNCSLLLPEGRGLPWAGKRLHSPLQNTFTPIELFMNIIRYAHEHKQTMFFLGARHDILNRAVDNLRKNFPGIAILGSHHGYFSQNRSQEIAEAVKKFAPHYLFIGTGFPRQEAWVHEFSHCLNSTVCLNVGNAFDLSAGTERRAPLWMRHKNIEGLYKVRRQPLRIFRFFTLPLFVVLVFWQKFRQYRAGKT